MATEKPESPSPPDEGYSWGQPDLYEEGEKLEKSLFGISSSRIQIRSIKARSDKPIEIAFAVENEEGDYDDFTLKSKDAPRPQLYEAMNLLRTYVADLLGLNGRGWEDDLEITGVTLTYGNGPDAKDGICVTALKPLRVVPAPLVVNTPHAIYEDVCPDSDVLVWNVKEEAKLYIKGQRKQLDLFEKQEEAATA